MQSMNDDRELLQCLACLVQVQGLQYICSSKTLSHGHQPLKLGWHVAGTPDQKLYYSLTCTCTDLSSLLYRFGFGGCLPPHHWQYSMFGHAPPDPWPPCHSCKEAFLLNGIEGLLDVHQKLLWSPFQPYLDTQLHLVWQCKLSGIGTGVYCFLNNILVRDIQNGWFTPSYIPLALLRLKSIRGCLQLTHSLLGKRALGMICKLLLICGGLRVFWQGRAERNIGSYMRRPNDLAIYR